MSKLSITKGVLITVYLGAFFVLNTGLDFMVIGSPVSVIYFRTVHVNMPDGTTEVLSAKYYRHDKSLAWLLFDLAIPAFCIGWFFLVSVNDYVDKHLSRIRLQYSLKLWFIVVLYISLYLAILDLAELRKLVFSFAANIFVLLSGFFLFTNRVIRFLVWCSGFWSPSKPNPKMKP